MRNIDKKYHYLYKTTNSVNGKYYYGIHSTNDLKDGYLGSGTYLRRAIRKYGKQNFKLEILEFFDNREDLIQAEEKLITLSTVKETNCMNLCCGGKAFNTGFVNVRDKNNNTFSVHIDDPRYLSGELVSVHKNMTIVKDENENIIFISKNDPRYLSGKYVGIAKGKINVKDKDGNIYNLSINDPRYLSGELIAISKGKINVKDKDGNILYVSISDPRYLSGELKFMNYGTKHKQETKDKIGKTNSIKQKGENNSQFGTCWITNQIENKKIKKEDLDSYLQLGWIKGRKI